MLLQPTFCPQLCFVVPVCSYWIRISSTQTPTQITCHSLESGVVLFRINKAVCWFLTRLPHWFNHLNLLCLLWIPLSWPPCLTRRWDLKQLKLSAEPRTTDCFLFLWLSISRRSDLSSHSIICILSYMGGIYLAAYALSLCQCQIRPSFSLCLFWVYFFI